MTNQGTNAKKLFSGKGVSDASRLLYSESADLFSGVIRDNLKPNKYTLVDLGGHKGEFIGEVLKKLPEYEFDAIIIDTIDGIDDGISLTKRVSDIINTGLVDKSVDIVIMRYVLAWNSLEKQRLILEEISRICKGIAIVQHQGRDRGDSLVMQKDFRGIVSKMGSNDGIFTNPNQIEKWMNEDQIKFVTIQSRRIEGLSDIAIEKYALDQDESNRIKALLDGRDYILQSTWMLDFRP